MEVLTGSSPVYHPGSVHTTFLPHGCNLRATSGNDEASQTFEHGVGDNWEAFNC